MKGFPNQVSNLPKLAVGMATIRAAVDGGLREWDDGRIGEALVRAGVLGTGHPTRSVPVEEYLAEQRAKTLSNQSHRASARGLRELYRLLGLIDESDGTIIITPDGHTAADFAGNDLVGDQIRFWRRTIRSLRHHGGDEEASHPYQVLLRLISRVPGVTRAMCALALEARNDSHEELDRIVSIAQQDEETARLSLDGVSKNNWNNAKKILPSFAEQLGDVVKVSNHLYIADLPGAALEGGEAGPPDERPDARVRRRRASRSVTSETIGRAGTEERSDEVDTSREHDPAAMDRAIAVRADRLRRHNLIVQRVARLLDARGYELFEDPFDCLALNDEIALLVEVKTLDGTEADEVNRVRDALSQLLYYESFVATPLAGGAAVVKIACFEAKPSDEHIAWLAQSGIVTIWESGEGFTSASNDFTYLD